MMSSQIRAPQGTAIAGDESAQSTEATMARLRRQQSDYWSTRLTGLPTLLELPTDHLRPAIQSGHGAAYRFTLTAKCAADLLAFSEKAGATVFTTLLAAFKVLLFRYSDQPDLCVGTTTASCAAAGIGEASRASANTLVVRTDLSGGPSFRTLLGQLQKRLQEDVAQQAVPFDELLTLLNPAPSIGYHPLFQTIFDVRRASDVAFVGPVSDVVIENGVAERMLVDLGLTLVEDAQGWQGIFAYATDLFEEETIARIAGHYGTLLRAILADANQSIDCLPLLSEAERRQMLVEWNDTEKAYPADRCIHQLFEEQTARTPDAVAVVCGETQLSYSALNAQANQLAHALRTLGVGPGTLVALCVDRSLEMVVGLLGVLKAGGAYVPLDPDYPKERLAFMLTDSQAPVLLTQQRLLARLPAYAGRIVFLDAGLTETAAGVCDNTAPAADLDDPAYVIYTSGSTGVPKGVVIPHRAIANHMRWMDEVFPLCADDCVVQKTPFSFDASVWEFYAPLLVGARLVLAKPGGHQDTAYLIKLITAHKVTILQVVPTMLRLLAEDPGFGACTTLRRIFSGGEALSFELQHLVHARLGAELVNLYGPTEATIDATSWVCERGSARQTIPIGRPIANTQAYILDTARQLVPVGVPGELYIGGAGLAAGYLHRPDLTAERFVPNPFSADRGARLYRTGDLVRYLPDGAIEYLGRLDTQVKFRGYRIELGEVETALRRHPAVGKCVVVVREDGPGSQQIVAYVVPAGVPPVPDELRAALRATVPDYMVPTAFVLLDALPLTPNGKVDRQALPAPDLDVERSHAFRAPSTTAEVALAAIWAEVLGVSGVGTDDNFFALGGHSLSAVQVLTRARKVFGLDIPLRALFEQPTLGGFAEYVALQAQEVGAAVPVRAATDGEREEMFL
jgi:amino acid adenylation domain-containing protein